MRTAVLISLVCAVALHAAPPSLTPEQYVGASIRTAAPYGQSPVAVASSGSQALAVWTDWRNGDKPMLYGTRIGPDNEVLDPLGIVIDSENASNPGVAWNGRFYVVTRTIDSAGLVIASRVSLDGTQGAAQYVQYLDEPRLAGNGLDVVIGGRETKATLSLFLPDVLRPWRSFVFGDAWSKLVPIADGKDWLAFYDERDPSGTTSLYQVRIHQFMDEPPKRLFTTTNDPYVSAASNGENILVAWASVRPSDWTGQEFVMTVHCALTTRDGAVLTQPVELDRTLIVISEVPNVYLGLDVKPDPPAVAWDGTRFVVAWTWFDGHGANELRASRISATGAKIDFVPFTLDRSANDGGRTSSKSPQIAFVNQRPSLLWSLARPTASATRLDLVARSVNSFDDLAAPAAPAVIASSAQREEEVALAAGDDAVFAVWREGDIDGVVTGRLLPYAGKPSESFAISTGPLRVHYPDVAWGGGVYLAVWREYEFVRERFGTLGLSATRILARRYDRSGAALDAAPLLLAREPYLVDPGGFPHWTVDVASDGQQFLVTWGGADDGRIHAVRVTNGGAVLDTLLKISPATEGRTGGSHAVWTGSEFFVAWYEDPTPHSPLGGPLPILPHTARLTRLSPAGAVLDSTFPTLATTPAGFDPVRSPFDVAFNGREMLVTWSVQTATPKQACVYARRFTTTGTPVDAQPRTMTCTEGGGWNIWNGEPQPLWDGSRWWLTYSNLGAEGGVFLSSLAADLTPNAAVRIAWPDGRPLRAKSVATPFGTAIAYSRLDAASGNVSRVMMRRTNDARGRAARH